MDELNMRTIFEENDVICVSFLFHFHLAPSERIHATNFLM